jgi:single-strand DNA-binding protein
MAMNQVNLVGRPTTDPELTFLQDGTAVTRFTLAVARDYKDNEGNRPADFVRCVIWGNTEEKNRATNFADYVHQGDLVDIAGRIETRSFEGQDGNNVYITEINVKDFHFLAQKQGEGQPQSQGNQQQNRQQNNQQNNRNQNTRSQNNTRNQNNNSQQGFRGTNRKK